jgi:hypothetical protein
MLVTKALAIALIFLGVIPAKAQHLYTNFILTKEYIWGLTSDGNLNLFENLTGKQIEKKLPKISQILFITKTKLGV